MDALVEILECRVRHDALAIEPRSQQRCRMPAQAHMRGLVVGKHVLALARRSERHRIIGQLGIGKHTIEPRMTARLPACLETKTGQRSEEHTSEIQSIKRNTEAGFC